MNKYSTLYKAILVYGMAVLLFTWLQFNPENPWLSEVDSYYHLKMAFLLREHGLFRTFPWLSFTTLKDVFSNHHLLLHLSLIPVTFTHNPIFWAKVFIVLTSSAFVLPVFWLLRIFHFPFPAWGTLWCLFSLSEHFYFRTNFLKSSALSLSFLFLGIASVLSRRAFLAAIFTFLYGWSYITFGFIPIFATIALACVFFMVQPETRVQAKVFFYVAVATLLCQIIHPYFPNNWQFFWIQTFQTGFGAKKYVGNEWHPYDSWFWFTTNIIALSVLSLSILFRLQQGLRLSWKDLSLLLFTSFVLVMQLKSRRFVEYASPLLMIAGLCLSSPLLQHIPDWTKWDKWKRHALTAATFLIFSAAGVANALSLVSARNDIRTEFSPSALKATMDYIKEHSQPGDIIFTDDWDVFPRYFYFNAKSYYLVGLDPEFMNQKDPQLYSLFADISSGRAPNKLEQIRNTFGAKWIVIQKSRRKFLNQVRYRPLYFKEVFFGQNDPSIDKHADAQKDGYYVFEVLPSKNESL